MEVNENLSEKARYDYVLVRRAVEKGDQKAYAELMGRYRDSIYFMLLKMINNKDDAEDLTIEAFGKAFHRLKQYTPNYAFSSHLRVYQPGRIRAGTATVSTSDYSAGGAHSRTRQSIRVR